MPYEWVEKFLASLAVTPNVSEAARSAGIVRGTAYAARQAHPDFAARWDDAIDQSTDALIGEMYRRAVHGTEKLVFHQGKIVGRIREYSDTLAIFLAKSHRRDVYGDKVEQKHEGGVEVTISYVNDWRSQRGDSEPNDPGTAPR